MTADRIACFLDGKQIVDQPREGHTFTIRSEVTPCLPLGIATYATTAELRGITWKPIAGNAAPPPAE